MTPVALVADSVRLAARRGADPGLFVEELDRQLAAAVARLAEPAAREPPATAELVAAGLREKIEASEVAALWMAGEFDLDLKLAFARLCGDEARHYRLLAERLQGLGAAAAQLDPLARGHSPFFRYLRSLETPCERVAAGAFARGGLARAQDAALADLCAARGDPETARIYREAIGAEEAEHHQLGRRLLVRFAVTPDDQERARRAVARTVQLCGDRRDPAAAKPAVGTRPGA
jgi:hypothetical protein